MPVSEKSPLLQKRRVRFLLAASAIGLLVVICAGCLYAIKPELFHELLDYLPVLVADIKDITEGHPVLLVACIAILPCFAFPVSPFLLAAGVYGPVKGIILGFTGIGLNIMISYLLSNKLLRRFIEKVVRHFGYEIPQITGKTAAQATLLIRVIPGTPLVVQNYLLGLAGIPFRIYLPISLAIQLIWVPCFVILGQAMFDSSFKKLITGIALLVSTMLAVYMLRKWALRRQANKTRSKTDTD